MNDLIFITLCFAASGAIAGGLAGYIAGRRLGFRSILTRELRAARRYPFLADHMRDFNSECSRHGNETLTCDRR